MKQPSFYWTVSTILVAIIVAAAVMLFVGCTQDMPFDLPVTSRGELHTMADAPPDFVYTSPATVNDTTETDSTVVDTIIPCDNPELILSPAFVTLWLEFDTVLDSIRWQGGGVESYDLNDVLQALTSLPTTIYNEGKKWAVIVEGTNNATQFNLKIFAKEFNRKVYMTPDIQGFVFGGALTFDEFRDVAIKYPSVKIFNFRATAYDSLQYIELAQIILGTCKQGRDWADFRFNPFEIDTSIVAKFEAAGWETVLH